VLEEDDPIYVWRKRMFGMYGGIAKQAVGHPESL
jgi:hypothetical protein